LVGFHIRGVEVVLEFLIFSLTSSKIHEIQGEVLIFWVKTHQDVVKVWLKFCEFWSSFDSLLGLDLAS